MIYKICPQDLWDDALASGVFEGMAIDLQDGFIHFSADHQVRETARRHFGEGNDLVLVEVDETTLGDELRWEPSRGGDLFPHLYGSLDVRAAVKVSELPLVDGLHVFPDDLPG